MSDIDVLRTASHLDFYILTPEYRAAFLAGAAAIEDRSRLRAAWAEVRSSVPQYQNADLTPDGLRHGLRQLAALWDNERVLAERLRAELAEVKAVLRELVYTLVDSGHEEARERSERWHRARRCIEPTPPACGESDGGGR